MATANVIRPHRPHTAEGLRAQFAAMGFVPGRPTRIDNATWLTDQRTARRTLCPLCNRRGLVATPYRNGERYRVVAHCPHCEGGVEL